MVESRIRRALEQVTETREIIIGFTVINDAVNLFSRNFESRQAVIIADENTFSAAGKQVYDQFASTGISKVAPIVFPGFPLLYASYENVLRLENLLRNLDATPVVIGSGTLNDLTKLASHHLGRPYMVFATAASMDGYTASGASISKDGFKQTFACPAPRAILVDLDVIMRAPDSMTASGYGDLLAKNVAGADWIIADELGIEVIDPRAWEMVQGSLKECTAQPGLLVQKDPKTFERFVEGLMLSGLSLQYYKGSRPASGAEHLMSHLWEMHETTHGVYSHGLKVGLATIASAALYERLLLQDFSSLDVAKVVREFPDSDAIVRSIRQMHPDPKVVESSITQCMGKYICGEPLTEQLVRLRNNWPEIHDRLQAQLIPAEKIREMMGAAGCITHPKQMGKTLDDLRMAYTQARLIRNRYTILDLAAETGCMEDWLNELFAADGFWGQDNARV